MYSTIVLGVDKRGEIVKIYNVDELMSKWKDIKSWLINAHPLESYDIIRAKEFELTDINKEIRSIKYIHFIYQFFFIFAKEPGQGNRNYIKKEEMDRFGAGIVIPINLMISIEEDNFIVGGQMIQDEKVVRRLADFSQVKNLKPEYKINGKYKYDGRTLEYSDFTVTEVLGDNYYCHSYMNTVLEKE
ncbi:hypothetical protein [Myroides sp. DF42-4-2]|uniref:hypothetical protein n=1 Tax=Myroides sp. DF42-4-2 TaxID=2746726 RepID=UPI002574EAC2|nr:hypothetical protein [Myroides sp. DF42-4-2]MDM1408929.1 hypothetical protein [Myroides sp. DF42-4-2]